MVIWIADRLQDVRVAARAFRRRPAFAVAAVVALGLGIGLATAVFTVANAVLLRRLAVRDQDRVVVLWGESTDGRFTNWPVSPRTAREFAGSSRALESVAVFGYWGTSAIPVQRADRVVQLRASLVSGNFFSVLGARPLIGRILNASDDVADAPPVVVLSFNAWKKRFDGDPRVLGLTVKSAAGPVYTVVGIMPPGLDYPRGADMWTPITSAFGAGADSAAEVDMVARLAAGGTPALAASELTDVLHRSSSANARVLRGVAHTLPDLVTGDVRPAVVVFSAAVLLLLVITCTNVANLLLVRGLSRASEMAVRAALGASRRRLVTQLLTENALLAACGGLLGLMIAIASTRAFVALAPSGMPRLDEIHLDAGALLAAGSITLIALFCSGAAPAFATAGLRLEPGLRSRGRSGAGRRTRRTTEMLVVAQLGLALTVLSSAALLVKTLRRLDTASLGFEADGVSIAELTLRVGAYDSATQQIRMLDRLVPAMEATPGVQAVSPVVAEPFVQAAWAGRIHAEGATQSQTVADPVLDFELVTPSYFRTLHLPVIRGRGFRPTDRADTPPVVILSAAAADHFWPRTNPIGRRVQMWGTPRRTFTVVGIVPDTRYRDLRTTTPGIYFPLAQSFFAFAPTYLLVRSNLSTSALSASITGALGRTAPGVTLSSLHPFDEYLEGPLAQPRFNAFLLTVFAGAAALLSAVGLLGIMSTMVRQRVAEFGIRQALGATSGEIRGMVLRRGLGVTMAGVVAGTAAAIVANRALTSLLYGVAPTDPMALACAAVLLALFAMGAMILPARASSRIEPSVALRTD